jgi:hypothetical protein
MDQRARTFVAFDLAMSSCAPVALPSQSVIGEINLLTIVIPGQGGAVAVGVSPLCGEHGFSKKFLPDPPNYKQVHKNAHGSRAAVG